MNTFTEAYEFLLSVVGNVPYGIIVVDLDGFITMVNEEALVNLSIEEETKTVLETNILAHIEDIDELKELLILCFNKGRKVFELSEIIHGEKVLDIIGKPILNGMLISINNVTATKKAQDEATLALIKGQEMERRRLAKEIHDGIGPLMSTIRLNLDAVKNELTDAPEKTVRKINNMSELVQNVATDIRSISHALMPGALVDFGLVEALKNLCSKATQSEVVEVNFYESGMSERLKTNIELNLFRIAKELLNNALKYAAAKNIDIQLIQRNEKIVLTVEDDGIGLDPKLIEEKMENGIGWRNINTRINSLGGDFSIETQAGRGVHFTVEISK
ncbi:MAG: ATP-binding protein [Bacteroidota bacterium]